MPLLWYRSVKIDFLTDLIDHKSRNSFAVDRENIGTNKGYLKFRGKSISNF